MRLLLSIATLLIVFVGVSHPLESNIPYIEWHPSENILAVSLGNSLQILDGTSLEIVNALFEVEEEIHTFAWSSDGSKIAFSTWTKTYLWNNPTATTSYSLMDSPYPTATEPQIVFPVSSIAWHPSDDIISGSIGGTLVFWDATSFEVLYLLAFDWSEINDIDWSVSNKIAIANRDSTVYIVNPEAKEIEKMYAISGEGISAFTTLDFDSSGNKLAFGWDEGFVLVWDLSQATDYISRGSAISFGTGMAHIHPVTSVDWSPNNLYIATGSQDGIAKIWNAKTGELLQTIDYVPEGLSVNVSWNAESSELALIADTMTLPVVLSVPQ